MAAVKEFSLDLKATDLGRVKRMDNITVDDSFGM